MTNNDLYEPDGTYSPRMVRKIRAAMKAKPITFESAEEYWNWLKEPETEAKEETPCK